MLLQAQHPEAEERPEGTVKKWNYTISILEDLSCLEPRPESVKMELLSNQGEVLLLGGLSQAAPSRSDDDFGGFSK